MSARYGAALPRREQVDGEGISNEMTALVNKRLAGAVSADCISVQTAVTSVPSVPTLTSLAEHAAPDSTILQEEDGDDKPKIGGEEDRESWDNKFQFILAVVGYAVGLGNVWRFPYLAQKNGGGAFLIPYTIMLLIEGVPVFYLELAVGQRLRKGAMGAWNQMHPYLGGMGMASVVVSLLVALYYNTIIAWCLFYFGHSFQSPLPWSSCPHTSLPSNSSDSYNIIVEDEECSRSSPTQWFWYRKTLDISTDIGHPDRFNWKLALVLAVAWVLVYLCVVKGIQSSGKVVYFTATFPYLVLLIFFCRGITLPGSSEGIKHLFTPQWHRLLDAEVWLEAATQIFFSLGLAFGGLIAFSSYMPVTNNIFRDAIAVSLTNCGTSVFAGIVVFSILGFKAHKNYELCMQGLNDTASASADVVTPICDMQAELQNAASGTGLAFIAFTEAIDQFPAAPFWAVLFFLMLFTLGIDSMFGTLEGVITSLMDTTVIGGPPPSDVAVTVHGDIVDANPDNGGPRLSKPALSAIICSLSFLSSLIFAHGAGNYVFTLFDDFTGNIPLLVIALMECIAVSYVYGLDRFSEDIELMTGSRPSLYWLVCWRFVAPFAMALVLLISIIKMIVNGAQYSAWDSQLGHEVKLDWPIWAQVFAGLLVLSAILWIPLVAFVRHCNLVEYDVDRPSYFPERELREHYGIRPHTISRLERTLLGFKEKQPEPSLP